MQLWHFWKVPTFDGNLKTFKTWEHHRIAQLRRDLVQAKEGQLQTAVQDCVQPQFCVSPQAETPQSFGVTYSSAWLPS